MLAPADCAGQPMFFRLATEQTQVRGPDLVSQVKVRSRYLVAGFVHQTKQCQTRIVLFQPGMAASIHL